MLLEFFQVPIDAGEIKSKPKPNWVYDKKGRIIKASDWKQYNKVPKAFKNKEKLFDLSKGDIVFFHAHFNTIHAKKNNSDVRKFRKHAI